MVSRYTRFRVLLPDNTPLQCLQKTQKNPTCQERIDKQIGNFFSPYTVGRVGLAPPLFLVADMHLLGFAQEPFCYLRYQQ